MRYPQGGGLTAERQQFREEVRLQAAERFAQGEASSVIAKDLRVSVRSVQRWRQMWDEGGPRALRSQGPASLPRLSQKQFIDAGSLACAEVDSLGSKPRITAAVLPSGSLPALVQRPGPETEPACLAVDAIAARPDKGALVRAVSASGSGMGDTTFLVTDEGVKYRLLSQEAIEALGLEGGKTRTLPAQLLSMLPTGPDLSPEAASLGEARVTLRCE
ncbi:transposase-like protein [Streptomyces sp. V4I23]|uniref:type VII secretion protein EccB n=1 Tax=Streptomyces sp. V4I23 TaxID=3042282 RepID=UPI002787067F|nr:type VII secretion protein EccB [Streptomyces sp. V4I23]MDQ1005803.1 transposase-like protein [Streptomyces sp. V4I23]